MIRTMKAQTQNQSKPTRVIGSGISFRPDLWEKLEAESNKLERPNRSLIVERALRLYFATLDATSDQRREGAA